MFWIIFFIFILLGIFTDFTNAYICILLKVPHHIHSSYFEVCVLYFSYISFTKAYCSKVAGL